MSTSKTTITQSIKELHSVIGENIIDNFNLHCYIHQQFEKCKAEIENKQNKFINWDSYRFPIDKLDGILVSIHLRVTRSCVVLVIESQHITDDNSYNGMYNFNMNILKHIDDHRDVITTPYISFEILTETFIQIDYYLRRAKFVKLNQQFEIPSKKIDCNTAFKRMFKGNTNMTPHISPECVVCYDQTNTKTSCGHNLCIPCWDKINPTRTNADYDEAREEEFEYDRMCPICRESLSM
jgi:hypothetical protein